MDVFICIRLRECWSGRWVINRTALIDSFRTNFVRCILYCSAIVFLMRFEVRFKKLNYCNELAKNKTFLTQFQIKFGPWDSLNIVGLTV